LLYLNDVGFLSAPEHESIRQLPPGPIAIQTKGKPDVSLVCDEEPAKSLASCPCETDWAPRSKGPDGPRRQRGTHTSHIARPDSSAHRA
jgi:hypothetical protein